MRRNARHPRNTGNRVRGALAMSPHASIKIIPQRRTAGRPEVRREAAHPAIPARTFPTRRRQHDAEGACPRLAPHSPRPHTHPHGPLRPSVRRTPQRGPAAAATTPPDAPSGWISHPHDPMRTFTRAARRHFPRNPVLLRAGASTPSSRATNNGLSRRPGAAAAWRACGRK